jgi:hypothetical protein
MVGLPPWRNSLIGLCAPNEQAQQPARAGESERTHCPGPTVILLDGLPPDLFPQSVVASRSVPGWRGSRPEAHLPLPASRRKAWRGLGPRGFRPARFARRVPERAAVLPRAACPPPPGPGLGGPALVAKFGLEPGLDRPPAGHRGMQAGCHLHSGWDRQVLPRGFEVPLGGNKVPGLQPAFGEEDQAAAPLNVIPSFASHAAQGFVEGCPCLRNQLQTQRTLGLLLQRHGQQNRHVCPASCIRRRACLLMGREIISHQLGQARQAEKGPVLAGGLACVNSLVQDLPVGGVGTPPVGSRLAALSLHQEEQLGARVLQCLLRCKVQRISCQGIGFAQAAGLDGFLIGLQKLHEGGISRRIVSFLWGVHTYLSPLVRPWWRNPMSCGRHRPKTSTNPIKAPARTPPLRSPSRGRRTAWDAP